MISIIKPVFAAPPAPSGWLSGIGRPGGILAPAGGLDFFTSKVVPFVISLLFYVILALSLFFIILGGIQWMMSGGEKEKLAKAKGTVTYAIVGLIVALGSFVMVNILQTFFGSNLLIH